MNVALGSIIIQTFSPDTLGRLASFISGSTREKRGSAIYEKLRGPIERTDEAAQHQIENALRELKQNGRTCEDLLLSLDNVLGKAYGAGMYLTDSKRNFYLLNSLDAKFGQFISTQHVLTSAGLSVSFDSVLTALYTEEDRLRVKESARAQATKTMAAAAQTQGPAKERGRDARRPQKSFKKLNHASKPNKEFKCHRCEQPGHRFDTCPYLPPSGDAPPRR